MGLRRRSVPLLLLLAVLALAAPARAEPTRIVVETGAPLAEGVSALLERAQLHYVAVARGGDNGTVRLRFGAFRHPAVIVLSSWTTVEWRIEGPVPEQVKAILLLSGHFSIVSFLPQDLPVYRWNVQLPLFPNFIACPSPTLTVYAFHNCRQPSMLSSPDQFGVDWLERHLLHTHQRFLASHAVAFAPADIAVPGVPSDRQNWLERMRNLYLFDGSGGSRFAGGSEGKVRMPRLDGRAIADLDELRFADVEIRLVYIYGHGYVRDGCQPDCSRPLRVVLKPSAKPVVLALASYDPVKWHLEMESGARLAAVILRNADASILSQIGNDVPVWLERGSYSVSLDWKTLRGIMRLFPGKPARLSTPESPDRPVVIE
ncbi:MAG: hypothetical protein AB7R90_03865 [Reyranellaceae bacterium]